MKEALIQITREAGEILLQYFHSDRPIEYEIKDDRSPVTEADKASDRYLRETLFRKFHLPSVSEEWEIDYATRKNWDEFFLIDPLDGTKDFLRRHNEFTINVALIRAGRPVLGIILAPALDELFYGEKGRGAFVLQNGHGSPLPRTRSGKPILARSRFHDNPRIQRFAELNRITESRVMSSAIRYGRLAEGVVTIYAGFNRSKEWDTAAGHCIATESGCRVIDLTTGEEPVYNKPDFLNNFFLACSGDVSIQDLRWKELTPP